MGWTRLETRAICDTDMRSAEIWWGSPLASATRQTHSPRWASNNTINRTTNRFSQFNADQRLGFMLGLVSFRPRIA